jgi:hypothetical protein
MHQDIKTEGGRRRTWRLIGDSAGVILTNAVPAVGVIYWNWPAFNLVVLYILEGLVVLFFDHLKSALKRRAGRLDTTLEPSKSSKSSRPSSPGLLFFETAFILFFGAFALMVFGPSEEFGAGFVEMGRLLASDLKYPFLLLLAFRAARFLKDLLGAGVFGGETKRPLALSGGGWMFLLFFAVMLAPLVAGKGPNPRGGLFALVLLKTAGELFAVWAVMIDGKAGNRRKKGKNGP